MFKALVKSMAYCSAVIVFILTYGSDTVNLFVSWNIISLTKEGDIIIIPLAKVFWYITGASILSFAIYCFLVYKSFFDTYRFMFWILFFGWLSFVMVFLLGLARPVPWYGLTLGLFCLFVLFWFFIRQVRIVHFGYNPK